MKLKKKVRKRLIKPVRKLVKRHGTEIAVKLLTGLVTAAAAGAVKKRQERDRATAGD